jgi:hypothetical protein
LLPLNPYCGECQLSTVVVLSLKLVNVCSLVHELQVPKCCRLPLMKVKAHNGKISQKFQEFFSICFVHIHIPFIRWHTFDVVGCMRSASSTQRYHAILDPEDLTFKDVPLTPLKSNLRAMTTSKLHYDKPRLIHE